MRTFESVKQALGWAVAQRTPRMAQTRPDERVQAERSSPDDGWTASAIFSALGRALGGLDPHGSEGQRVIDWATRSDHDVDEDGRSWSTHPADIEAAKVEDDGERAYLRGRARRESREVARAVEVLEVELAEVGLLVRHQRPEVYRWFEPDEEGVVRGVWRSRNKAEASSEGQAELAQLEGTMIGPRLPPRDLVGARLRYGHGRGFESMRDLDRAIAEWASVSERTARTERLRWGIRGRAGRRVKSRDRAEKNMGTRACTR